MNAVSFKFGHAPYFNLSAGGSESWLDWTVGIFGEIFIDQKFMGLFSLLFGGGMILFIDRASARGRRAVLLNLWRNGLLLLIGIVHFMLWDGDVLMAYAISSVFLIALRKLPNWGLISVGVVVFGLSIGVALLAQYIADETVVSLSRSWAPGVVTVDEQEYFDALVALGFFLRALGLILVGAGLYRTGFMSGEMPAKAYRQIAIIGLTIGLPLATAGVIITALNDYSREIAFIGQIPNTLGDDSRVARIHEPDHSMEQPRRTLAKATIACSRPDGTHQLSDADRPRRARVDNLARQRRLCEPQPSLGVCSCGLGAANLVVAGVVKSLPIRTSGMALARRYIP